MKNKFISTQPTYIYSPNSQFRLKLKKRCLTMFARRLTTIKKCKIHIQSSTNTLLIE